MRRPSKVVLNGHDWTIEYLSMEQWKERELGEGHSGETWANRCAIYILIHDISEEMIKEVLLHELLHASAAASGATYAVEWAKKRDAEEVLIGGISLTLLAALRRNRAVREYLLY